MKTRELKAEIDKRFWDEGKALTKPYIRSLSNKLLQLCEDRAGREGWIWTAALYRFVYGEPKCATCGTDQIKFRNFRDGYGKHCSPKCAGADTQVDKKRKATNIERHGVERPQQHIAEIRSKFKRTMRDRYGVTYSGESSELRRKAEDTLEARSGHRCAFLDPAAREKAKNTMLARYGVEYLMQNRTEFERQQRAGFKARRVSIGGKTFSLRGSEHLFVKWLVEKGVEPRHILTTAAEGVPSIPWVDNKGTKHVYHPDAYVKYKGRWYLVEIKSTFTLGLLQHVTGGRSGKYAQVRRKAVACKEAGYRFKLFVVAADRNKPTYIAAIDNLTTKTKAQVRRELKLLHPGKFRQL